MAISGFANINTIQDESLKNVYKSLNSAQRASIEGLPDSGADLSRAVSSVAISKRSRKLNRIWDKLDKVKDPEARRRARAGLQVFLDAVKDRGDDSGFRRFLQVMEMLEEEEEALLHEALILAHVLESLGKETRNWVQAFLALTEVEDMKTFLQETRAAMQTPQRAPSS
jgi:hypothetical protein